MAYVLFGFSDQQWVQIGSNFLYVTTVWRTFFVEWSVQEIKTDTSFSNILSIKVILMQFCIFGADPRKQVNNCCISFVKHGFIQTTPFWGICGHVIQVLKPSTASHCYVLTGILSFSQLGVFDSILHEHEFQFIWLKVMGSFQVHQLPLALKPGCYDITEKLKMVGNPI